MKSFLKISKGKISVRDLEKNKQKSRNNSEPNLIQEENEFK